MTRDEFKRHLKASVHIGTGQTRKRDKQADSAEIELLTRDFLANGGQIQELASEQQRPHRSPAFNPGDIGGEV
ncbi:hypothetical protein [Spongiibacter sp.]|uniref:hypothetical protein n=1 Tax=Spongiibacter sp. TaxID=2024860 RepID=UPI000C35862E|nr:hypothetical protein [Spongiibacter sp.]MBU71858.1 hypothetical protein [Spongiibacter sp.]HCP19604.1 hypothetical protein [Marinobacter nauticus]|tara:strand:- start:27625 stop:27843 length:219 start_codon:yes stop_codon:yes gene_type:complete